MRRRSPLVTVIAVLLALCATGVAPAAASAAPRCGAGADIAPAQMTRSAARQAVLCLLNRRRAAHGLPRLRTDERLRTAARRHSVHMARAGFFSHTSPSGATSGRPACSRTQGSCTRTVSDARPSSIAAT